MTIIPLGHALPHGSSHLPADSVGHVIVCLLGVAPRRDCRVSPQEPAAAKLKRPVPGLVSVALILASRRTGVTRYAALRSPDFPLRNRSGAAIAWLASHAYLTRDRVSRPSSGSASGRRRTPRPGQRSASRARPARASAPSPWASGTLRGSRSGRRRARRPARPALRLAA